MGMMAQGGRISNRRNGRGRDRKSYTLVSEINVTPMVDVMLVLLVIFMVAAPMMVTGVEIDLPAAGGKPLETKEEPIAISITKEGDIFIDKNKISVETLAPKILAISGAAPKNKVDLIVRGDGSASYAMVMSVLGQLHQSGYTRIALETDATKGR